MNARNHHRTEEITYASTKLTSAPPNTSASMNVAFPISAASMAAVRSCLRIIISASQSRVDPDACHGGSLTPLTYRLTAFKSAPRRARTFTPSMSLCSSNSTTATCPIFNAMSNDDSLRLCTKLGFGFGACGIQKKQGLLHLLHFVTSALFSNKILTHCRCPCHDATNKGNVPSLYTRVNHNRAHNVGWHTYAERLQLTCRTD